MCERRGRTSSMASVVCMDRCMCKAGLLDEKMQAKNECTSGLEDSWTAYVV